MNIVSKEKRIAYLIDKGVPPGFLETLQHPTKFEDLEFIIKPPDAFYFYFSQEDVACGYSILEGSTIVPIGENCNGDLYYVLLDNGSSFRFIYFCLEEDEILRDYGSDFTNILTDLLIDCYEFEEEYCIDQLVELGLTMGFEQAALLFSALEKADTQGLRKTDEGDKQWRRQNLPKIIQCAES